MSKLRSSAFVAALAFVAGTFVTSSYAADLGSGSYKDGVVSVERWQGIYGGIHAGFGVGDTTGQIVQPPLPAPIAAFLSSSYDIDGGIYGGQLGYNFQSGSMVAGIQGSFSFSDIDGQAGCVIPALLNCSRDLDWLATITARLGYASNHTMFYVLAGVAIADVNTSVDLTFGPNLVSGSDTHVGWTAGLGVEHAVSNTFSVFAEYSRVDLGDSNHALGGPLVSNVEVEFDSIRIGANLKFSSF